MPLDATPYILVVLAFFVISTLYSAVGFGGGSSYLAILALGLVSLFAIRATAVLCNLIVVSGSCLVYYRKGHVQIDKSLPFIITSIPMSTLRATHAFDVQVVLMLLALA